MTQNFILLLFLLLLMLLCCCCSCSCFQVPHYPWPSLVAEFGGTLSLFLGVSFMTLWDAGEVLKRAVVCLRKDYNENY